MKRSIVVLFIVCWFSISIAWSGNEEDDSFQFPGMIKYKMFNGDNWVGSCQFSYQKKTNQDGVSFLSMKNFQALGVTSREWLFTHIFTRDSSIYADFIMKEKTAFSEIRLKDGTTFEGKPGKVFIYKNLESDDNMQTEIFTKHTVIDLLSMLFVTSEKVGSGKIVKVEEYNFLIDKSTKIFQAVHMGKETIDYKGQKVVTEVFSFSYHGREIFRLKIIKDSDGYCFPISVILVMDIDNEASGNVEMIADSVKK